MDVDEARRSCTEVMRKAAVAVLTTLDEEGYPHARGMLNLRRAEQFPSLASLFAAHDDDMLVYLSTNTASAKVRQVRADGRVSVYYCLPDTYHGVTLLGIAEVILDVPEKERLWIPGWEVYYPGGVTDPDYALIRLRPTRARYYHGLETVDVTL